MRRLTVMMILSSLKMQRLKVVIAGVLIAGLSGCVWVEDNDDLVRFVADVRAKPKGKIEPLPTFKPYESFVYQGASLRDPFVPLVKVESETNNLAVDDSNGLQPDQERPRSYLEQFSVDDLKMVGTIGKAEDSFFWALVQDPNGEIHRVAVDDYIGLDYGRVASVQDQLLEIQEIISNGRGGWMQRPRSIKLVEQE